MANTTDIGHSGLETRFGRPSDDFLNEWYGPEKVKRVTEMLKNSPVIAALRLAIEMPLRAINWEYTSEDGEDDPRLELLNAARDNLSHSWNDHIVSALLFPFYGWSMFTITYERVGGRLLWRKFKELGQDTVYRWQFDDGGGLKGLEQDPWLNKEPIPIDRMLIYRFRYARNNPEGESILRPAWIPYYYVKNLQQIEAIGIERNLNGLPVIHPPMGADMTESASESSDYGRAHAIVRNVRNDDQAGVVLPAPTGDGEHQRWQLELLSGGGMSKVIDTDVVIARYEKRMLMAALAQFLILGQDKVGALSLSEDQTSFFQMAISAVADIVAETHTKFAMPRLLALNGFKPDGVRLEHGKAGDTDTVLLADALQKLTPNITWLPQDEMWLRDIMGMPEVTPEQIEEERERKQTLLPVNPGLPFGQPGPNGQNGQSRPGQPVDENAAEFYVADNAPDDDERRKAERRMERSIKTYFADLRKRVYRGAREHLRQ